MLIVLALACLLLPQVALADAYSDATAAYNRGDYQTAGRLSSVMHSKRG
jgi:hypothetical protein